jgi:hypothetical protein
MRPAEVIREARDLVSELTGYEAEHVTGFRRDGDGWIVTVEVLEVPRVPSTMDVLGTYEITLSDGGGIVGFRRLRRHHRAATEEEN